MQFTEKSEYYIKKRFQKRFQPKMTGGSLMIFESKYRRQALESWASTNEEAKKNMLQATHKNVQTTTKWFKKSTSFITSMWG